MYNNEQAILNFGYVGQTSERLGRFDDAARIMSDMQKEEDEKHRTDPERRYKVLLYLQHIPLPNGMSMYDWLVAMSGGTDLTVPSQPLIDFVKYCLEDPLTVVSIKPGVSCLSLPNVLLRYFGVHQVHSSRLSTRSAWASPRPSRRRSRRRGPSWTTRTPRRPTSASRPSTCARPST